MSSATTASKDSTNEASFDTAVLETGRFELDDTSKFNALKTPKQRLKKCMQFYESLQNKTKQTVRIVFLGLTSVLLLAAIVYISKSSSDYITEDVIEQNIINDQSKDAAVPNKRPVVDTVELPAHNNGNNNGNNNGDNNGDTLQIPVEVFKDMQGKAREYDRIQKLGKIPKVPGNLDGHRTPPKRRIPHTPNDTEIDETLQILKKKVDRGRKEITSKELRLWESGTEPLRILIVSTWRSGSTFLSGIIGSHPGVFQHFEPLSYAGVSQIRSGKEAFEAQQLIHQLLDCDYKTADKYMDILKDKPSEMLGHNFVVRESCKTGPNDLVCFTKKFLSEACQMFPIQSVKTVRMRLNMTQLLLNDDKMRAKVVFLVRDPRGTMSSRYSSVKWCNTSVDCSSPSLLCEDIQGDLKVAAAFEKLYPDRFITVKYEDISMEPEKQTIQLFSFLGLEYTDSTASFIAEHTSTNFDAAWSTKRKSSDRIDLWKKQLPLEEIHDVQNSCGNVIKALNYEMYGE